jgi:hypothetical protein
MVVITRLAAATLTPSCTGTKSRSQNLGLTGDRIANASALLIFPRECGGSLMCDECVKIDDRIGHLRVLARGLSDPQTLKGLDSLISELEARKYALHPERLQ